MRIKKIIFVSASLGKRDLEQLGNGRLFFSRYVTSQIVLIEPDKCLIELTFKCMRKNVVEN